ncbi:MAG: GIY-YIG nuclease family protein [Pedosphaera sp.]|nr:GIY-YIG nuclease family protein [Pedosphaera sp.]
MAWVYMLRGSTGRHYIGSTTDLDRRIDQHHNDHTHSTKRMGDLTLVASVEMTDLNVARTFERELKRKKNPKLALFLLEKRKAETNG